MKIKKKQYGGDLQCGLHEKSTSFLILGHGCDTIDEVNTLPNNWIYITSGLCGLKTNDSLDFIKLKRDFFTNEPYIQNPCLHYETLNSFFTYNMNIHFANSPSINNRTYVNSTFILLTDFYTNNDKIVSEQEAEYWSASKSGIYINTKDNSNYTRNDSVVTLIKNTENQFIITEYQIERIYEGSILPKPQQVIQSLRKMTGKTDKYTISELRYCMYHFRISLSKILTTFSSKWSSGVIFNPLCRNPCNEKMSDTKKYELRRVNSLQGMEINQQEYYKPTVEDDIENYLGGKKNKYKQINKQKQKYSKKKNKNRVKKRKQTKRRFHL